MAAAVLPGENPEEYTALFNEVWSDCKPVGPVEQSLVGGIASFLWRKRRLGIFRQAEAARKEFGACFADGDLAAGTANASHQRLEKEKRSLELISKLREGRHELDEIKNGFSELGSNLDEIERKVGIDPEASRAAAAEASETKIAQQQTENQFAFLGDLITPECFLQELELRERLDAAIERAFDRLVKYQKRRISGFEIDRRRPQSGLTRSY
ncbi:MAG: hypothetical protein E6G88_15920 [Alphaproteobacteria bacterium]|nr:MAG: hypothetical protein E6G88_15920 [Alphaproteobacteria bacterium]